MTFLRKVQLLFVVFVLWSTHIHAQHAITGRIVDERALPADGAVVMLMSDKDKTLARTTVADEKGEFTFSCDSGHYVVHVRFLGYEEIRQEVQVTDDVSMPDMRLIPTAENIGEVTVTARKRRPMAQAVDGKIRIDVSNSYLTDMGNALDVLRHSPGISVSQKGEVSLSALGGTSVYVNGKRVMLQGEELAAYLRTLPSTKIERVEASATPNAQYDTDGAGGIVNIVLKQSSTEGLFVSTSHGVSYWENLRESSGLSVSYNTEKWQVGISYSHAIGHYSMKYGSDKMQDGIRNLSETSDTDKRNTYSGGADFVWSPGERHKLSAAVSFNLLYGPGKTSTETNIYDTSDRLERILRAENDYIKQRNLRYGGNVSYTFTPSKKRSLSVIADLIRFEGLARCHQPNSYFTPDGTLLRTDLYHSEPRKDINIYSLMLDYKYTPEDGSEMLAGLKTSAIRSDNDFRFQANGVFDVARSNRFDYTENNVEGYFQYTKNWGRWTVSGGMRLEYMRTEGKLQPYDSAVGNEADSKKRFNAFPNASVAYSAGAQTKLSLQYSRRQDKPRYEDLNPFEYLLDELTYWKGNPFLKPQISNKVALYLSVKQLSISLFYSHLSDYFTSLTDVYGTGKTIMSTKNIGRQEQLGLEMVWSHRLTSWWDVSSNVGMYYFANRLDYETYKESYRRPSITLQVGNDVALPAKLRLELTGRFLSKRQGGSYEVARSSGGIDMGISREWLAKRLRLSLLMSDILHTERWDSYGSKGSLDLTSWGYGETRQVMFRVRYSFGTSKFKANESKLEELNRL